MDERPVLTFTLRGLDDREAKLFRSFVTVVGHRTQHRWEWTQAWADLVVLPEGCHEAIPGQLTLQVGHHPPQAGGHPPGTYLRLPLRAGAVEDCLNALGLRALPGPREGTAGLPSSPGIQVAAPDMRVQLLRWPPQQLLTGAHHIRLATLMTGQPTTMQTLCRRSDLAPEICAAFLNRLDAAGLLHWTAAAPRGSVAPRQVSANPRPGVLDRIRRRLVQLTRATRT